MSYTNDGSEHLAPVILLFGGASVGQTRGAATSSRLPGTEAARAAARAGTRGAGATAGFAAESDVWFDDTDAESDADADADADPDEKTPRGNSTGGGGPELPTAAEERMSSVPHRSGVDGRAGASDRPRSTVRFVPDADAGDDDGDAVQPRARGRHVERRAAGPDPLDRDAIIAAATARLTRSLGRRGLSLMEARSALRAGELTADEAATVVDGFVERGWLDDAVLAEQLVHNGSERKSQGRTALAQTLAKRGIPRDIADAALAVLPDDDAERALEFARSKARSMTRLDRDAALRRLLGQLARRGFGGSPARAAAEQALTEAGIGASGVRFR